MALSTRDIFFPLPPVNVYVFLELTTRVQKGERWLTAATWFHRFQKKGVEGCNAPQELDQNRLSYRLRVMNREREKMYCFSSLLLHFFVVVVVVAINPMLPSTRTYKHDQSNDELKIGALMRSQIMMTVCMNQFQIDVDQKNKCLPMEWRWPPPPPCVHLVHFHRVAYINEPSFFFLFVAYIILTMCID